MNSVRKMILFGLSMIGMSSIAYQLYRVFAASTPLFFEGDKNINDVRVLSQEPRLKGGEKVTHSIIVHNYNFTPVALKLLITYYSPKGNSIWDTTIVSNVDIPPESNQKSILQVMRKTFAR